ncbi:hypothetical protein BST97_08055 [Nonlabens spongiae]|uniref:Response regulatory domain-containing protein n=1 Tax=Nonlabens spongiae TaxID=331648 RepID=A0A1W6MK13_9FLAO|nr:response regulator transcription factor [Nonlabens spongiae]ARN77954.1 hypothetical protein BST97_08055 [Nonlabens spongiae]
MFQKVLVAEDLGSIGFSVVEMLGQMGVTQVDHVLFCDDAYQKLMYAQQIGKPYDLFISDLSFGPDFKSDDIQNGMHLIKRIREQMEIKTIVYSIDNNLQKVRMLVDKYEIDAYVSKGRKGPEELKKAIRMVEEDDVYYSKDVLSAFIDHRDRDINDYDIKLLQLMSEGNSKQEISAILNQQNIEPNSVSVIDRCQRRLLMIFDAKNDAHLIGIVKDLGLI